jgi:glycosyltransferase involved in cell wall biosynthesis
MRIAHVIPSLARGGAERLTLDIVETLRLMGHDAVIFCLSGENLYAEDYPEIHPIVVSDHFRPSLRKFWKRSTQDGLTKALKDWKPDVVHSHLWAAEVALIPFEDAPRFVVHMHDNMPQLKPFPSTGKLDRRAFTDAFERRLVLQSWKKKEIHLLCISHDALDYARSTLPNHPDIQIFYRPNAINLTRFKRPKGLKTVHNKIFTLVNVGSFVPKKNQSFLLDVLEILIGQYHVETRLVLLGDGPLRSMLREKVTQKRLESYVEMPGNVSNVAEYFHEADVYVHSAWYEPFGLVLLEAMAAGLPVVALDGRGNRDIIQDGINGFLLEENDPGHFARTLLQLRDDAELRENLIREGFRTSEAHDILHYCKRLVDEHYR